MSDMLDALLASLPDSAYFERREIGTDLREKLRAEDIPFAGYLRGAAVWDLVAHPDYPIYSISKTNSEDNVGLHNGYGNIVLSSVETGELLVVPMQDDSGKMPAAGNAKPAAGVRAGHRVEECLIYRLRWGRVSSAVLIGERGERHLQASLRR